MLVKTLATRALPSLTPTGPFRPISCPEDLQASSRLLEEAVRAVAQAQREEPTQRQEPSEAFAGL